MFFNNRKMKLLIIVFTGFLLDYEFGITSASYT